MLLKIRTYGDPVLRKISNKVEIIDDEILKLIDDMVETMYEAPGVGLAAPQIGVNKRVVVIDLDGDLKKIINPIFLEKSGEEIPGEEGCLSIPGIYEKVKRPSFVRLQYMNEKGENIVEESDNFLAKAFQHEIDHLDGVLFVDRLSSIRKKLTAKKLAKLKKETVKKLKKGE